jgi:uncharacterized FAD-dependent dehydrogenase
MILLNNLHMPLDFTEGDLLTETARQLRISEKVIDKVALYRKSVDARHKSAVHFCCSVTALLFCDESKVIAKCRNAQLFLPERYIWPKADAPACLRPVIAGFGPAGMFAALTLARAGLRPVVVERGQAVDMRTGTVERFMSGGELDPESNVLFGEGGAGTFSDGKLNTGIKNIRCRAVLEEFVRFGAPREILTDAKPHIGTDRLVGIVKAIRQEIISLGGEVRFSHRLDNIHFRNGRVCGISVKHKQHTESIACDSLILATGHSARDIFVLMQKLGVPLERKPFSVGARIEHRREDIDRALYGDFAGHKALGAADYKLAAHLENGHGVYTFCMCPGGEVINSSSEQGFTAVNGMSYYSRDGENSNSALLVDIRPEDFEGDDPLAGMYLQRDIERRAYEVGGGMIPVQSVGMLLDGHKGENPVAPTVRPGTVNADIYSVLPHETVDCIKQGLRIFGQKIGGFDSPDAVLSFPETRSSSPVRILRNESGMSLTAPGLFPCGEGAGYAGGIMSAAVDGIRIAENVIKNTRSR